MSKITNSAKGKECDIRIPFACRGDTETTVHCHLPDGTGTGHMAGKSKDIHGVRGCANCHDILDGRRKSKYFDRDQILLMAYQGQQRTLRALVREGFISC